MFLCQCQSHDDNDNDIRIVKEINFHYSSSCEYTCGVENLKKEELNVRYEGENDGRRRERKKREEGQRRCVAKKKSIASLNEKIANKIL